MTRPGKRYLGTAYQASPKQSSRAFTIYGITQDGKQVAHDDIAQEKEISDIEIHMEDTAIPDDKISFKVEFDRTLSIVNAVLNAYDNFFARLKMGAMTDYSRSATARRTRYIVELEGICHVGLAHDEPSQLELASKSLASFRENFVAQEAGSVKNSYLTRLGFWCLLASAVSAIAYTYVAHQSAQRPDLFNVRNIFLIASGSCIGTWLSFSLRRVVLTFQDLATLEEDRLDPVFRVLFNLLLSGVVGMLLIEKAVAINIGQFNTENAAHSGQIAFLIGLLLGVGERAMATSVENRATEFSASIGSK